MMSFSFRWLIIFTLLTLSSASSVLAKSENTKYLFPLILYLLSDAGDPPPTQGGIAMTFDDRDISGWYAARHIFDRYNAEATFFLSSPDILQDTEYENMMRTLTNDGHELAAHGYRHNDVLEYDSMDAYFNEAVYPHTESVVASGFKKPGVFSYPFGRFTQESDDRLLEYYRFVRYYRYRGEGDAPENYAFYSQTNNGHSIGTVPVDEKSTPIEEVIEKIERAHVRNEIIVFTAHRVIENWEDRVSQLSITHARLDTILKAAHDRGMRFYVIGRLPEY